MLRALAVGVVLKTAWQAWLRHASAPVALLSLSLAVLAVLAVSLVAVRQARNESRPARLLSPSVLAAGNWLRQHNSGGTIVSTVMNRGMTERAVLAMGNYTGLMYYGAHIVDARSLPPAGLRPLIESQQVLEHPGGCAAPRPLSVRTSASWSCTGSRAARPAWPVSGPTRHGTAGYSRTGL